MFSKTGLFLAVLAVITQAAPIQSRAEGSGTNINVVQGSTSVFANADGTFHVDITNGNVLQDGSLGGTFGLTITDKTFALNVACLNDAALSILTSKCSRLDNACLDKVRKACTQGNKIGSATAPLNADKASAATKLDTDPAALANNKDGSPLITGGTPREIGAGLTGSVDDGKGTFDNFMPTPIRAVSLQIGCLVDESQCQAGDPAIALFGTGDCTKDRITCEDASGLTGLSVKMNND